MANIERQQMYGYTIHALSLGACYITFEPINYRCSMLTCKVGRITQLTMMV